MDAENFRWAVSGLLVVILALLGLIYRDLSGRVSKLEIRLNAFIAAFLALSIDLNPDKAQKISSVLTAIMK